MLEAWPCWQPASREFAQKIGLVVAVGAHDDMGRVARFFAANTITKPDGAEAPFHAHEYGVLVLAYSHLEDFFSPADVPIAREAMRQKLWELPDPMGASRRPESRRANPELDQLFNHREVLRTDPMLQEITLHKDEMDAVSPHGPIWRNLSALRSSCCTAPETRSFLPRKHCGWPRTFPSKA